MSDVVVAMVAMKTTHAQFIVTMNTNSLETLKFIVKEESGRGKTGNPLHQIVKV